MSPSATYTEESSSAGSPVFRAVDSSSPTKLVDRDDVESGYASGASSTDGSSASLPQIILTKPHLRHLNEQMERMGAVDRLRFVRALFPNLYQSTAFGLSGLVTIDMLSKIQKSESEGASSSSPPQSTDLIFLDTLHHFQETLALVERVKARYPNVRIHTYRPDGATTAAEFDERYGERLYETAPELYDWIAKVEPQQRAYAELNVAAVLTGRRRSQGGERDKIPLIEVDEERGIVKINPLVDWSFAQVKRYIDEHGVPYNELLNRGYKSIGDWHSTSPVGAAEDERAGRWRGQNKTECGIHNKKSRYAEFLEAQVRKQQEEEEEQKKQKELTDALEKVELQQKQQEHQQVALQVA